MNRLRKAAAALLLVGLSTAALCGLFSRRAAAQEAAGGRKFAFLVRVESFENGQLQDLEFTEDDVEDFDAVLNTDGYRTLLLTTKLRKTDPARRPGQECVWNALAAFLKKNKPT